MATDQISFYDETLKKQIEGSFLMSLPYTVLTVSPYNDLGACIDYGSQVSLVRKLLSELARDPGSGKFKGLQQQREDQQLPPMQRGGSNSCWGRRERFRCQPLNAGGV